MTTATERVSLGNAGLKSPAAAICRLSLIAALCAAVTSAEPLEAQAHTDRLGDPLPAGAVGRLGTLRLRYSSVGDIAYLPDGRALVGAGRDIDIWDMAAGEKLDTLRVAQSSIRRIQLLRDASRLVILDGSDIIIYDITQRQELARIPSKQPGINWVAVSPDESRVISTSRTTDPPTLKEFDLATGAETFSLVDPEFAVFLCAVYTPDGKSAFVGGGFGPSLAHYDLTTGEKLLHLELNNSVGDIAVSPDGQRLLVGCRTNAVELSTDGYAVLNQFRGHHGHQATAVAYADDALILYTGARDGSVRRWDRASSEPLLRWMPHSDRCTHIRVSPDGSRVLSFGGGMLVESDAETGESTAGWQRHSEGVRGVTLTPDGRQVLSASSDGTIRIWDLESSDALGRIDAAGLGAYAISIAPDGGHVAVGCKDGRVREFSLPAGEMTRELSGHVGYVRSVLYTPDGTRLVTSGDDGRIRVWSMDAEEPLRAMKEHLGGVLSLAVSEDGRHLVSGGRDGTVRLWELATGRVLHTMEGHRRWVEAVCFAPGGQHAYSTGGDGRLIRWDISTGASEPIAAHEGWILALACSADGRFICAGGEDNLITIWDVATGAQTATLRGHSGHVTGVALTPDGHHLVSSSLDSSLLIWALPGKE